jgi:rare lipoprotein A (peptidoglycan hydrolase)
MPGPPRVNSYLWVLVFNCVLLGGAEAHSSSHSPSAASLHEETGLASFYGQELKGHRTASGRRFDDRAFTAASLTLPLNSKAEVCSLKTGLTVMVTITDRGPFTSSRLIDLSKAAAEVIGITSREGLGMVVVRPLGSAALSVHHSVVGRL